MKMESKSVKSIFIHTPFAFAATNTVQAGPSKYRQGRGEDAIGRDKPFPNSVPSSAPPPGHFNDLDYSICVEPESGFCGIQYQQMGRDGFSLTNATAFQDDSHIPSAEVKGGGREGKGREGEESEKGVGGKVEGDMIQIDGINR